jgi:hypothetical protein
MSQTELTPEPANKTQELSRRTVLRFAAYTVLATLAGCCVNALFTIAGNGHGFDNHFREGVSGQSWFNLVWNQTESMKPYVAAAILFAALIYPMVLLWRKRGVFGRKSMVWGAATLGGILAVSLMLTQGWKTAGDWFGTVIQQGFSICVLYIIPVIAVLVCGLFYLNEFRRLKQSRLLPWPVLGPVAVLIGLVVTGYGFVKEDPAPKSRETVKPKTETKHILTEDQPHEGAE